MEETIRFKLNSEEVELVTDPNRILLWVLRLVCTTDMGLCVNPRGGGEPAIIGVGAAVGNAIFDATGARLFRVPFTPERVSNAVKKAQDTD